MVQKVSRPTLKQVAERAGVSLKTVSRVFNNEQPVSESTARAVHQAAKELGFRVNTLARELRAGASSTTVGLLVGDLANPYWSGLARGVEREVSARGLRLLTASTDESPDLEWALAQDMLDRRVCALLVVTASERHAYLVPELQRNVAIAFLDRPPGDLDVDTVLIDNAGGARSAVRHLADHGHRAIALVGDFATFYSHRARRDGYDAAMEALGFEVTDQLVLAGASDAQAAEAIVSRALDSAAPPTAFFALNNWITAGALRAIARIPEVARPALVGFDDIEFGDLLGVTVVSHDAEEMGKRGALAVLARLDGNQLPAERTLLGTRLIPRGSGERRPAQHQG